MPKNLTLRGKMSGPKKNGKKDGMLMQSQVCRNSDMKAEMEKNATKEDFFPLKLLRQISRDFFFCFSLCAEKDFPLDQFFIRRLTEQACPLTLTLYSLIPSQSSTPPALFLSLTHTYIYSISIHCGPHTQPENLQRT